MLIGYAGAFLGGAAAILSPCAALLLPAFFAYAFGEDRSRLVGRTVLLWVGTLLTLVPLGLGAGALGSALAAHRGTLTLVGGVLLIVFGALQALGVPLAVPGIARRGDPRGPLGAVLLGATYGLAGSCTGPLLGGVLDASAQYRLEGRLGSVAGAVPDLAFLLVIAALGGVALWRWRA